MNERTIKCPICGEPYVVYAFYSGDQSACPECRAKARALRAYNVLSPIIQAAEREHDKQFGTTFGDIGRNLFNPKNQPMC